MLKDGACQKLKFTLTPLSRVNYITLLFKGNKMLNLELRESRRLLTPAVVKILSNPGIFPLILPPHVDLVPHFLD